MNIGHIENGIVLDHITPGNGMNIYNVLDLVTWTAPLP